MRQVSRRSHARRQPIRNFLQTSIDLFAAGEKDKDVAFWLVGMNVKDSLDGGVDIVGRRLSEVRELDGVHAAFERDDLKR